MAVHGLTITIPELKKRYFKYCWYASHVTACQCPVSHLRFLLLFRNFKTFEATWQVLFAGFFFTEKFTIKHCKTHFRFENDRAKQRLVI